MQFPFLPGIPAICNGQKNNRSYFINHIFFSLNLFLTICLIFLVSKYYCQQSKSKWYLDTFPTFYWECYEVTFLCMINEKSEYPAFHLSSVFTIIVPLSLGISLYCVYSGFLKNWKTDAGKRCAKNEELEIALVAGMGEGIVAIGRFWMANCFLKGLSKSKCEYLITRDRTVGEIQYWCNFIAERNFRKYSVLALKRKKGYLSYH